jgi:hypothetical protein
MPRGRAKFGRWPSLGFGLTLTVPFAWQFIRRIRLVADRTAFSLEFASSAIIISEKLAEIGEWFAKKPLPILLVAFSICAVVVFSLYARNANMIADEPSHFEKILQFCRRCRKGAKIRVYVRIRRIAGELILPSESYFSEMEELARSKGLDVRYLFGIAPGDVTWLTKQSLMAFLSQYQRFSRVRVVYLRDDVILRNRLTDLATVVVLLGDRSGLRHERDSRGAYIHGRSFEGNAFKVAQRRFERFYFASMSVEAFLHRPFDDKAPTAA